MKNKKQTNKDLRILWSSNGTFTNSGYGTFSRDLIYRMAKEGYPVAVNSFWGIQGFPVYLEAVSHDGKYLNDKFKDIKVKHYPCMADPYGGDSIIAHGMDWGANAIFTMQDVWTLDPAYLSKLKVFIPYVPIDKDPVPPQVLEKLKYAYKIITFSKKGQEVLENAGFTSTLIVEGTDTSIFKPMDRAQVRKDLGLPQENFYWLMVAANKENPPRKGWQEALEGFKLFHDNHPEAALLIHCQQESPGGFPIKQYAQHLGILPRLFFVEGYQAVFKSDSNMIAKEMNASNALLHPSQTEGFGLTIIEAQACGIPVVASNYMSMPELIIPGKTGEVAELDKGRFTQDLSFVYPVNVRSLHEKMEKVYEMVKKDEKQVAIDCREWIEKEYNIDTIFEEKWKPLLNELSEELIKPEAK